jgi:mRNA interferase RelE/StbE
LALISKPLGSRTLQGQLKGLHRIRSGDFRIIYRIEENRLVITVIKIGGRKDIYER